MESVTMQVTGFAVIDGVLYVYRDPESLRRVIMSRKFDQTVWLNRAVIEGDGGGAPAAG